MLPLDCLNIIVHFSSPQVLINFICSKHFYHLITNIHFWINKCQEEKLPMYIGTDRIETCQNVQIPNLINLYSKSLISYKKAELLLGRLSENTYVEFLCSKYITLPSDYQYEQNTFKQNFKIIVRQIRQYYVLNFYGGFTCSVHQNYNQLLSLFSYLYANN